jgi:carbonic anhydrase/acetyltransferase-like protein (isoleucine patch superfamily)
MGDFPETVYVHPAAVILGDVSVGEYSSLWPGAALRGDFEKVTVGRFTSVQDNAVLHAAPGAPVRVGDFVTVAHLAMLHGCVVEDDCIISMHAVVQDHCVIGAGSIVAAGATLRERTVVPPGSIVVGVPARVLPGKPGQRETCRQNALSYAALALNYRRGKSTITLEEIMANIARLGEEAGLAG